MTSPRTPTNVPARSWDLVIPNPKLRLMDQVREGLRERRH
jgi:hypothetical protein